MDEAAESKARQQQSQILLDGARTQGHHSYWIEAVLSGKAIGGAWLFSEGTCRRPTPFLYDLSIEETLP
jgi:hypothetical protein